MTQNPMDHLAEKIACKFFEIPVIEKRKFRNDLQEFQWQ